MAMDGSPSSKKKKLCKDVGGSSEEGSSEETSQSTTSPKKSQEKLSSRHSGSSSQEQTPQPGTSRSPTSPAQTPPKNLQEQTPRPGTSRSPTSAAQIPSKNLQEQTPQPGTSRSPNPTAQTPPKNLQEQTPQPGTSRSSTYPAQTHPSAGASEETEEIQMCPNCKQPFIKQVCILHYIMGSCSRKKPTPSPTSPAQAPPKDRQETEQNPLAGIQLQDLVPIVITLLIPCLKRYKLDIESQQTSSAGSSRTSEEVEELHTCLKCGASFTSMLLLVYHLLKIHTSNSPSQEQTPSAETSQPSICPAEDLSTIDMIDELITFLETYRQKTERSSSAGTSRTSEETEESHTCSKCGKNCGKSIFVLVYHMLDHMLFKHK